MSTPPPILTELRLTPEMKEAIDTALVGRRPVTVVYVNDAGEPEISYRGSTQAYSDSQLAIWVRNPEGGILKAVRARPAVALMYGNHNPDERGFLVFHGRAHAENGSDVRRRVYEHAPEIERNLDKERKGVPLIIDLEKVDGFFGGAVLRMRREA
ncbi:MAG TPA: pyridoxamine 5'-phosphate oxidase family protein [Gammaproteobacteria bacterium]|nr:pyridoxamine 5'-phosphate oxidase family protein [Gammaproteobacteria bacterium]